MRLVLAVALLASFLPPLEAQRGYGGRPGPGPSFRGPAIRNPLGTPTLPPGVGLNGILGPQSTVSSNGLPVNSNFYKTPCFGCSPVGSPFGGSFNNRRGSFGRSRFPYVGVVPFLGTYFNSSPPSIFDEEPVPPPVDPTTVMVTEELGRLRSELDQLKAQPAPPQQVPAGAAEPPAPAVVTEEPQQPATIIVLNDGRRLETTNYAVMDKTVWNFSARPIQKFPISAVDVAASTKANADRGIEFNIGQPATP